MFQIRVLHIDFFFFRLTTHSTVVSIKIYFQLKLIKFYLISRAIKKLSELIMLSIKKNMLTKIIQKCEKNMLKLHLLIILHLMKRKECILNR